MLDLVLAIEFPPNHVLEFLLLPEKQFVKVRSGINLELVHLAFGTDFDELFLRKQSELEETLAWKFDSKHEV